MIDPTYFGYLLKRPSVPAFRLLLPAEEAGATLKLNTLFIAVREGTILISLLHIQKSGITVISMGKIRIY
jgi:hypothetical protein